MKAGPSYRQIIDVSDWENSKFVIPMGQSGNLFSSHFEDYLGNSKFFFFCIFKFFF